MSEKLTPEQRQKNLDRIEAIRQEINNLTLEHNELSSSLDLDNQKIAQDFNTARTPTGYRNPLTNK